MFTWLTNRIVLAVLGALIIGATSAGVGIYIASHPTVASSLIPSATATATDIPTATSSSSDVAVTGSVTQLNRLRKLFTLVPDSGPSLLIQVTSATTFSGDALSWNDVPIGARVEVMGTRGNGGTVTAQSIFVSNS